jgi:hypothetical protein
MASRDRAGVRRGHDAVQVGDSLHHENDSSDDRGFPAPANFFFRDPQLSS